MASRPSTQRRRASVQFGSRTDIGCVREHNEDSLVVAPPLYAVADGMGGHAAGEVASEIAVRTLAANAPDHADTKALGDAVIRANYDVINAAQEKGRTGMGTTITAAVLDGPRLAIAQVGDSRAYLLHQGVMQQITRDHSLMADLLEAGEITQEEARVHPQRSVITRALGSDPGMQPDLYEINVSAGDRLLLCSDGLTTMLEDDEIERLLNRTRNPQRAASILVNEAISAGGHDNVTVVVVDVEGNAVAQEKKARRHGRLWAVAISLALIAVVCGIVGGVYNYSQGLAYLKAENGYVAVYRGVEGEVFGRSLSSLDHVTDVSVDDLTPHTAERLKNGVITKESLQAANDVVEQYRQQISEEQSQDTSASDDSSSSSSTTSSGKASSGSAKASGKTSSEDSSS